MHVLIVDDSVTMRQVLKGVLVRDLDCTIAEAAHGIEALERLERNRFDVVMLDVNMPVMDGVETLQAIRSSPMHATLPVVILTSQKQEGPVRQIVELGISAYLLKGMPATQIAARLSPLFASFRDHGAQAGGAHAGGALPLNPKRSVLVVDRSSEVRRFMADALGSRAEVVEAASGPEALNMCLARADLRPQILLAGADLGPMPADLFVSKARSLPTLEGTRLIAVLPEADAGRARTSGLYDGVVTMTFVPQLFHERLEQLLPSPHSPTARRLPSLGPGLRSDTVLAAEQIFGMIFATEIRLCSSDSLTSLRWPGTGLHARVTVDTSAADLTLGLLFRSDLDSSRAFSALALETSAAALSEADLQATGAEIANIIAGRLRNRLILSSIEAQCGLPSTWIGATPEREQSGTPHSMNLWFESKKRSFAFNVQLAGTLVGQDAEAPALRRA